MNSEDARIPAIISNRHKSTLPNPDGVNDHDHSVFIRYINATGRTIYLIKKNGGVFPIPSRDIRNRTDFIIRKTTYISSRMVDGMKSTMADLDDDASDDLKDFSREFFEKCRDVSQGPTLNHDYCFSTATLKKNGGAIYHIEEDIIISLTPDNILHPNSLKALRQVPRHADQNYSGIEMKIVDNTESIGSRYTRLLRKVVKIPTEYDPLKPNGLYVSFLGEHDNRTDKEAKDWFKPMEEMDDLPFIFKSHTDAKNSPEGDLIAKMELADMEKDLKKKTLELSQQKLEAEQTQLALEQKNAELQRACDAADRDRRNAEIVMQRKYDAEDHQTKMNSLRSRDYYEERSSTRKDSSEVLKALPGLVAGAAAVFLAIRTVL